ncbi:MAG TPA: hypothetical protein VF785_21935 [Gemmatimonadaceae bacterium]
MSVLSSVRAVRTILGAGLALRAAVWGALASLTLIIGSALADTLTPLGVATRASLLVIAVGAGVGAAIALAWRDRHVLSLERVALWIEERFPSLDFTLVTAVETGDDGIVARGATDSWTVTARQRAIHILGAPLLSLLVAGAIVFVLPAGAVARVRAPHRGDSLERTAGRSGAASRLSPLVAQIIPPRYSQQPSTTIDEPRDVRALVGSTITLRGRGSANGIVGRRDLDSIAATPDGDRWSMSLRVDARPVALRLVDREFQRLVAIEPVADAAPAVALAAPAHDSVVRLPRGRVALSADASDDFGIASAAFEYIVSSGEGETFTFRSGTLGATRPNARHATISASLPLESLGLKPGDVVHVRAVARDANDVSGPGVGASETRTIRIARHDEYDSVAVEAAAPSDADKSVISERMLIMLTEALEKARPKIKHDSLVTESRAIANDQKRLRRTVGEIVFTRLGGESSGEEHTDDESPARAKTMQDMLARADSATNRSTDPIDFSGGESPVVAINKPLLEAYNAMWDASTELEIAEPARALPHMRRALAAVQRARAAERLYLRGRPPEVVVDVNKARLQGKDKGASSVRPPTSAADSSTRRRIERLERIVGLAAANASAAIDSLLVLRIESLSDAPAFAAALGDAATAMRGGKGAVATEALARARRSLAGGAIARDSLTRWGVVP